jgi:SWI/SNF-related matrix-associated actin-dependent regulator of chromatin subfamily A protein 2/4
MDRERRHADARMANRKSRLFELSELPAWLTKDPKELENAILDQEQLDLFGRGSRHRKEIDYSDSLTEKEWLKVTNFILVNNRVRYGLNQKSNLS